MPQVMTKEHGFSIRQVYVDSIVPSRNIAMCKVVGSTSQMQINVLPVRGPRSPRAGDTWMVETGTWGSWAFTALVKSADSFTSPTQIQGYGPPVELISADYAGQEYIDLRQTNGAKTWRAVVAGDVQWEVTYGQTSWVVPSVTVASSALSITTCALRRTNNRVEVTLAGSSTKASSMTWQIPTGFLPDTYQSSLLSFVALSPSPSLVGSLVVTPGNEALTLSINTAGQFVSQGSWMTQDSWPTS